MAETIKNDGTTAKTEAKESTKEKKTEKKDQQQIEIDGIKDGFRRWRKIFFVTLLIFTVFVTAFILLPFKLSWVIRSVFWIGLIASLLGLLLTKILKLITEGERGVVLRFKEYHRTFLPGPNLMWLWPFEKVIFVDIREREEDIPPQKVITNDNVNVTVDAVMNFKIQTETPKDQKPPEKLEKPKRIGLFKKLWRSVKHAEEMDGAAKSRFKVQNPEAMLVRLTMAAIRDEIGAMEFEKVIGTKEEVGGKETKEEIDGIGPKEKISSKVTRALNAYAEPWGIVITRVKIENIIPPDDLMEAMNKRMIAKQLKAATITESEGEAQKRENVAEGEAKAIDKISAAQARRFKQFQEVDPQLGALSLDTAGKITPNKIILIGRDLGDAARNLGNLFWYPKKPERSHPDS